ncbi:hypothetical protein BST61_g11134 [Cercospora zeina]
MATPWAGKGTIHEYQFFDCTTHGTTRWHPLGDRGQNRPASELHEHLRSVFGANRNEQITWHKGKPPGFHTPIGSPESGKFEVFVPPQHCQIQTRPLEELYPNEDNTPLKIGHAIVCLHVDNGVTTRLFEDEQADEPLPPDAAGDIKDTAAQSKKSGGSPLPNAETTQPLGFGSSPDSEETQNTEPQARRAKGKGKGRVVEKERGVERAQAAPAANTASSVASASTQAAGINTRRTEMVRHHRGHPAAVVAGPSSRPVAKPVNPQVAWTEDMKLCLWVMDKAFGPQLSTWKQKADVWNEVFKGDKIFKGDNAAVLSSSNSVAMNKLSVQYTEREKAMKEDGSLPPALQQWKDITGIDQTGQKFRGMQQRVQAAIDTLSAGNDWTP